jgi:hypothetical protein
MSELACGLDARGVLPAGVEPIQLDVTEPEGWEMALSGVDAVVHLAARAHVVHERESDSAALYAATNVEGVALRSTVWDWGLAVGGAAAFAAMLGLAVGIEALYQRPLWLLFALAELLRQRVSQGRLALSADHAKELPESHSSDTPVAS